MMKKSLLLLALMAILVTPLFSQQMRHRAVRNMDPENCSMDRNIKNRPNRNYNNIKNRNNKRNMRFAPKASSRHSIMLANRILAYKEQLELSSKQVENIEEIQTNFNKQANTLYASIKNIQIDKREAMQNQNFKQASDLTKEIYQLKEQLALSRISAIENIYKNLSEEQIETLQDCKYKK